MNNRLLATLKNQPFFFLWLAEVFSQFAMNMMNFILILVAFSLTNSNTAVSGIVLCFTIPAVIFGIIAGIFVDRWNKKYVLFATNALRAGLLVVLALLHTNLVGLYALTLVISVITQFFIPAETPMIPLLVSREQLFSANALFSIALYGSVLVAYALSGPFLLYFGPQGGLFFLAGIFLAGAISALSIQVPRSKKPKGDILIVKLTIAKEIRNTLHLIAKIKNLYHAFLLLALCQVLILSIAVIGPGFAKQVLHISIDAFPILFVTPAVIGMAISTFVLTNYFHHVPKQKSATVGLLMSAVVVFCLSLVGRFSPPFHAITSINAFLPHLLRLNVLHFLILLSFVLGVANALIFVPSNTIIQEETSDEIRGKVYGSLNAIVSLASLLPVILVGSLADVIGVGNVLVAVAVCIGVIGVVRIFVV